MGVDEEMSIPDAQTAGEAPMTDVHVPSTLPEALEAMRGRGGYDQALLDAFAELVAAERSEVGELSVTELQAGMTLAGDVRTAGGELVAARGHRITEPLIERLRNLGKALAREPVQVFAAQDGG